jgi:exopolysaccharide biosynthesis protein
VKSDYGVTLSQALGAGSEMLRDGRYVGPRCGRRYGFFTRPRTMVAWNADDGRYWLFSAQSTGTGPFHPGNRGLSYSETSDLLRRLGATDAVPLDGGGSTTLVFAKSGGGLTRVDAAATYPQRAIPDVMVLTPR